MAAGVELAAFAYSIYSCSLAISSLCCLASLFFCCRSSISLRLSRFSSSGLADWLRSRMVVSAWVDFAWGRLFSSWRAWSAIMGVWWAGLCALGVWSTNSPSGDSNLCCWSSGSVSEPEDQQHKFESPLGEFVDQTPRAHKPAHQTPIMADQAHQEENRRLQATLTQ